MRQHPQLFLQQRLKPFNEAMHMEPTMFGWQEGLNRGLENQINIRILLPTVKIRRNIPPSTLLAIYLL